MHSPLLELLIYYFAGRAKGTRRVNALASVQSDVNANALSGDYAKDAMPVIWDFGSRPYALGDILTTLIEWNVFALNNKKKSIDIYILADPNRPSSHRQPYINSENFEQHLIELLPAFNFCPLLRNTIIVRDRNIMEKQLLAWNLSNIKSLPSLNDYNDELNAQAPFRGHFTHLKSFYQKNNYLPQFSLLKYSSPIKEQLMFGFKSDTVFVTIHIRQRRKETSNLAGGAVYRDADIDVWQSFIDKARVECPNVVFNVVGRVAEFPRRLYQCSNVVVLKHFGFGLVDELTAIQHSDFFMANISGPAMFAMFTNTPYVLFQQESNKEETAEYFGEPVGCEQPFFAAYNQKIIWRDPTANDLIEELKLFLSLQK